MAPRTATKAAPKRQGGPAARTVTSPEANKAQKAPQQQQAPQTLDARFSALRAMGTPAPGAVKAVAQVQATNRRAAATRQGTARQAALDARRGIANAPAPAKKGGGGRGSGAAANATRRNATAAAAARPTRKLTAATTTASARRGARTAGGRGSRR